MHTTKTPAAAFLVLAALAGRAEAWGSKEHILLTELATLKLMDDPATPPAMKAWLQSVSPDLGTLESQKQFFLTARVGVTKKDATGMTRWCIEPDNRAGDKTPVEPFGIPERPLHFVDLEMLNPDIDRQAYKHDLSSLPKVEDAPRDMADPRWKKAGMLPFAVEYSYKKLVESLRANKLDSDPATPADEDNALRWAGFLAHYLEDNTQPLHASEDYQSRSYFADRRGAPNVHSEMEYRMNDDEKQPLPKLRADYWDALMDELKTATDPITTNDLFTATLQVCTMSYRNIPLIGLAAMDASGQQGTPDKPRGKAGPINTERFFRYSSEVTGTHETVLRMKARQQAWAVVRVARIWRQAWDEAYAKS